jgi:hypothetical protein
MTIENKEISRRNVLVNLTVLGSVYRVFAEWSLHRYVVLMADRVGRPLYKSLTTPNHIPYCEDPLIEGLDLDRQLRAFDEKRKLRNRAARQAQVGTRPACQYSGRRDRASDQGFSVGCVGAL